MTIREITPNVDRDRWLAGADFADAFRITIDGAVLDARTAAERMLGHSPWWMAALLKLRNGLIRPLGLKTSGADARRPGPMIGMFPVIDETPGQLVLGFDDKHLDFRVLVDVATVGATSQVTATTLVQTHNALGRIYLTVITPFHRLVVKATLRQVAVTA
ncbi:DUF2867 domain-containing protein [Bradyrhizobium sp. STM 3809]|uniref:DUF2867 domain-containing protein n=1 Tax=Bradyrhizobium sp. STM 3809 TaxID=551936 RepID=UPI00024097CA|nr:DUF2867 domain-containing protein [Bradyrhizobium sp. STM 3809]CCE01242.1 conserved hypothetical protein [Bradyrhizobium sp. STM 3809]